MKLILLETKCMPILLEKSFKKWITGCGWKWDSIEFKMYGTNAGPSSGAAVPSGLVGLWNLMTSHQSVLIGLDPSPLAPAGLGSMVGYGAFLTVHLVKEESDQVAKISQYGVKTLIVQEASVLAAPSRMSLLEFPSWLNPQSSLSLLEASILCFRPRGIRAEMHLVQSIGKDDKE
jgi:hypothetical protein